MAYSGKIYLYDKDDRLLSLKRYYTLEARREIIYQWCRITNPEGYIQIIPHLNTIPRRIKENITEPIVRPPATYSNNRSLYPT
jgi:hypothetical protein